jgi:hypothetical protein
METPPTLPPAPPEPLGKPFFITLLAPVASMALAALASLGGKDAEEFSFGLSILTLPAMLVCSIICGVMVGKRKGGGMGFLAFLGFQVLYIAVAFGGCAAVLSNQPMNFH